MAIDGIGAADYSAGIGPVSGAEDFSAPMEAPAPEPAAEPVSVPGWDGQSDFQAASDDGAGGYDAGSYDTGGYETGYDVSGYDAGVEGEPAAEGEPVADAGTSDPASLPGHGDAGPSTHTVQDGDSLSAIAAKYGTTVEAIAAANNISDPNLIYPGQQLTIPGSSGSSGSAPVTGPGAPTSTIPGAEQAIQFAMSPPSNKNEADGTWYGWCLGLTNQAYQAAGNASVGSTDRLGAYNAIGAYNNYAAAGAIQTQGTPPRGALVFYGTTPSNPDGHIGISLGDGRYVGTMLRDANGGGPQTAIRPVVGGSAGAYLGWAVP